MLTLIAESKTMNNSLKEISIEQYKNNEPKFEADAQTIMSALRSMSISEISERLKITHTLALKAFRFAEDFIDITHGNVALDEFTGEVFRALSPGTLIPDERSFIISHTLIVSSVYGILHPSDIIRPYRMDFSSVCSPEGGKLYSFWKRKNTIYLVKLLKELRETEILNLLPGEAMKCIDFKLVKAFASVEKPDFKLITDYPNIKSPASGRLKELRGLLLRQIAQNNINSFSDLHSLSSPDFFLDPNKSLPGYPMFLCDR